MIHRLISGALLAACACFPARAQEDASAQAERNNLVHPEGYEPAELGSLAEARLAGTGERALVLFPGWAIDGRLYDALVDAAGDHYRFLVVTPAGYGGSKAPPMPPPETSYSERTWSRAFEKSVWEAIEEHELDRPVLVGFSEGFAMAVQVALAHPDEVAGVISMSGELYRTFQMPLTRELRTQVIDTQVSQNWFRNVSPETWANGMGSAEWLSASADGETMYAACLESSIPTMVRYFCESWSLDPRESLQEVGAKLPMAALLPDPTAAEDAQGYQQFTIGVRASWDDFDDAPHVNIETLEGARMGLVFDQVPEVVRFLERTLESWSKD